MTREPVQLDTRKAMTPARRKRVLAKHGDTCSRIDCNETQGLEIDHIIALALGGRDHEDNLAPLCAPHHKIKTARDLGLIAKAKRIIRKADPGQRKASRLQSRGFDKTKTKRFDGTVVAR